ncbi:hypothetical protein RFI_35405 [Reticulomyxa filosa]|uniref:Uncharacterized protein n=1 Tax=Reticulomyxa filosa TaxID=46433 RepID=X6LMS9_RETFI|nr:hypothetical protein RFI_35405 [Reticulomyxa filosa]|eukprot:ETO02030.1 hypothetical protein RFI_35405 [Reticulomyxa filosa]
MGNQIFQTLKDLPTPFFQPQCVLHKHEVLICGGARNRRCFSYHTLKNEYKFICKYPSDVRLLGHCVVKLIDNNNKDSNEITLLSFGGEHKHTLIMKYVSVWDNDNDNEMDKLKGLKKINNYNEWIPFTDNHNNIIQIGRDGDNYEGVRAVIGGSSNNLLFITYPKNNISVFDLNTFQFIKHDNLPIYSLWYHCFVSKSENRKNNKNKIYEMILFCKEALSIGYDEDNNTLQYHILRFYSGIAPFYRCASVCINDVILFFGGLSNKKYNVSKAVHKYLIQENAWIKCELNLPIRLYNCFAVLSEDKKHIHLIGGSDYKGTTVPRHMKTKVIALCNASQLVIFPFNFLKLYCFLN